MEGDGHSGEKRYFYEAVIFDFVGDIHAVLVGRYSVDLRKEGLNCALFYF